MVRRSLEGHSKQVLFYVHDTWGESHLAIVVRTELGTWDSYSRLCFISQTLNGGLVVPFLHLSIMRAVLGLLVTCFWISKQGTDSRGTGHFTYESDPGFIGGHPIRCTNRSQVLNISQNLYSFQCAACRLCPDCALFSALSRAHARKTGCGRNCLRFTGEYYSECYTISLGNMVKKRY